MMHLSRQDGSKRRQKQIWKDKLSVSVVKQMSHIQKIGKSCWRNSVYGLIRMDDITDCMTSVLVAQTLTS